MTYNQVIYHFKIKESKNSVKPNQEFLDLSTEEKVSQSKVNIT